MAHTNPAVDYVTSVMPRRLSEILRWSQYVGTTTGSVMGMVKKFGEYPITRLTYNTPNKADQANYQDTLETKLNILATLTEISFDLQVSANSFITVYKPFTRWLICRKCRTAENINSAQYSFNLDKLQFKLKCRACKTDGVALLKEEVLRDTSKLHITRWNPLQVSISQNPISGATVYYVRMDPEFIYRVRHGDPQAIETTPLEYFRAMQARKVIKFSSEQMLHTRLASLAGVHQAWGLPPLLSAFRSYMHLRILEKANEAIALDSLNPLRVLHPLAASAQGEPLANISLANWVDRMKWHVAQHRRDPLHIILSPVPVGYQQVGGDGRAMLTYQEQQEAAKSLTLGYGVPYEFVASGGNIAQTRAMLRSAENQLRRHTSNLNAIIQWVANQIGRFMGWPLLTISLADFAALDDPTEQNLKLQLWSAPEKLVSNKTVQEMAGVKDVTAENAQIDSEHVNSARRQQEMDRKLQQIQTSPEQQAQQQAMEQNGQSLSDPQTWISQADEVVAQLQGMDPGLRRSRMDALQTENYVLYCVVQERMQQARQNVEADARAAANAQGM